MNIFDTYTEKEVVAYLLKKIGVGPHILGYKYAGRAVELVLADKTYLDMVTKRLYYDIAKEYDTTTTRVERAIRHAVEYTFNHNKLNSWLHVVFADTLNDDGKVCNSQFIATLAELISVEKHHPIFNMEVRAV